MKGLNTMSNGSSDPLMVPMQISPSTLFFIEGCGQLGYAMCWGDGFVTDPGLIQQFGLTDPKPILNQILAAPYAKQVVISPHYYPPSISGQTTKCASATCSALHESCYLSLCKSSMCTPGIAEQAEQGKTLPHKPLQRSPALCTYYEMRRWLSSI